MTVKYPVDTGERRPHLAGKSLQEKPQKTGSRSFSYVLQYATCVD